MAGLASGGGGEAGGRRSGRSGSLGSITVVLLVAVAIGLPLLLATVLTIVLSRTGCTGPNGTQPTALKFVESVLWLYVLAFVGSVAALVACASAITFGYISDLFSRQRSARDRYATPLASAGRAVALTTAALVASFPLFGVYVFGCH